MSVVGTSASIYFYAGDFADALRRHEEGTEQIYATHDEVAKLMKGLVEAGVELTVHSFITPEVREERPIEGLRILSLGAKSYADVGLLSAAVANDPSAAIVAQYPSPELLRAVMATDRRAIAVLANSYNHTGLRAFLERRRMVRLLNSPRFELVSNHCLPATEHLAKLGVRRDKLIAWDVPHRFDPADVTAKALTPCGRYQAAYAGTINEDKGVGDLIRATAALRRQGIELQCGFAGSGATEEMKALGRELGVRDLLDFRGLVPNRQVFGMFRDADVVVVPSRTGYPEGFPLTMFEAIGSRTPIVCSDHPMFRPILKDGVNAAVFPAGDAAAFAAALLRTLTDVDVYARLSENAMQSWAALKGPADWRTMVTRWVLEGRDSPWLKDHKLDG